MKPKSSIVHLNSIHYIYLGFSTVIDIVNLWNTAPPFSLTAFLYFCATGFYTPSINGCGLQALYIVTTQDLKSIMRLKFEVMVKLIKTPPTDYDQTSCRVILRLQFTAICYSRSITQGSLVSFYFIGQTMKQKLNGKKYILIYFLKLHILYSLLDLCIKNVTRARQSLSGVFLFIVYQIL